MNQTSKDLTLEELQKLREDELFEYLRGVAADLTAIANRLEARVSATEKASQELGHSE